VDVRRMAMERDKVIATLEYCLKNGSMGGKDCRVIYGYKGRVLERKERKCPNAGCETGCMVTPIRAAVELLKAQEPEIEVLNEIDRIYRCPNCHVSLYYQKQKFCAVCGQAVKWG
jgi:hypothetical protein